MILAMRMLASFSFFLLFSFACYAQTDKPDLSFNPLVFIKNLFSAPEIPAFERNRPKHGGKLVGFALQDAQASPTLFKLGQEENVLHASIDLNGYGTTPKQLAEAAAKLHAIAPADVETFSLTLNHKGIKGPHLGLLRRDMERLYVDRNRSPNEIWHNLDFHLEKPPKSKLENVPDNREGFRNSLVGALLYGDYYFGVLHEMERQDGRAKLLYRTQAQLGFTSEYRSSKRFYIFGTQLNVNLADNLDRKNPKSTVVSSKPVRSDLPIYQEQTVILDHLYAAVPFTIEEDYHFVVGYGYLEEMFDGFGAEALYRPLNGNWAFGASYYGVSKRDPFSEGALSPTGQHHHTAHLTSTYTAPSGKYQINFRGGRYLAGDYGADALLRLDGPHNSQIEFDARWSTTEEAKDNKSDSSHFQFGLHWHFPLGTPLPGHPKIDTQIAFRPLAQDTAQAVRSPFALMELTQPVSKTHLRKHWADIDQPALYPVAKPKPALATPRHLIPKRKPKK